MHWNIFVAEKLNTSTLRTEIDDDSVLHVDWDNPQNTLRDSFTYVVSATVVEIGEMVEEPRTIAFAVNITPHVDIDLNQYTCEEVNISIHIFNSNESISQVVTPLACTFMSRMSRDIAIVYNDIMYSTYRSIEISTKCYC